MGGQSDGAPRFAKWGRIAGADGFHPPIRQSHYPPIIPSAHPANRRASMTRSQLSATERRVVAALDIDGLVKYLCSLVAIESLGGNETPAQQSVAAQMKQCGLEVDMWEIDFAALRRHPQFTVEIDRQHGLGVVGSMGKGNG